jgi:glycosyltransferase involved in cell wall biosynthesis
MIKVHVIGTFDETFNRNKRVNQFLQLSGFEVVTSNFPVWGDERHAMTPRRLATLVPKLIISYFRLLIKMMRDRKSDVFLFLYPGWLDVIVLGSFGRLMGRKVVFDPFISLYDTVVLDRKLLRQKSPIAVLARIVDVLSFRLANLVLADTNENARFYASLSRRNTSFFRVLRLGGQDLDMLAGSSKGPELNTPTVLFHGTFIPLHGIEVVINAARILEQSRINIRIVGGGQLYSKIKMELEKTPLANVVMTGQVSFDEVVREIESSTICLGIFGSSDKSKRVIPNKVLECAYLSKAIISQDSVAMREVFSSTSVFYVKGGDAQALADAILTLCSDEVKRNALGRNARTAFEQFATASILADDLNMALSDVVEGKLSK